MNIELLVAFVFAALIVLLIPGPGVLYVITRSLLQGRQAGLVSVMGLSAGALVHVVAATVGLSAILMVSSTAFTLVKWAGAAYLIYLGLRLLVAQHKVEAGESPLAQSPRRLFLDGVMVSILNPKIAVFFLAFLPQFVALDGFAIPLQLMLLGLIYVALAFVTDGTYALLASYLRRVISEKFMRGPVPAYASGLVYLGLGLSLALTDRKE
ncbi:MAG: LysE family translocator [Pseudomonadota bacterium]